MQRGLAKSLHLHHQNCEAPCHLSHESQEELRWWKDFTSTRNGLDIQNPAERNPDLTIHCDASDLGWGVSSHEMEISGRWTNEEKTTSINVRELKTILFALKLHAEKFREKNIQIFTDNITALKYSTKAGGTASPLLQELAIEIQDVINSYNLTVTYSHIPEILNVKADTLSRIKASNPLYEATMPKKWFQVINQKMGPLKIDGFAARHNTKLKTFWSYRADPEARAVDAFRQVWPKKGLYLFPPWQLIPKVLRQIRSMKLKEVVLVTPWWPTQYWFPTLLQMKHR